jgi:hypothetical protein
MMAEGPRGGRRNAVDDRRFYSTLFLCLAPAFMAGGWLAAFTDVGAGLIYLGSGMAVAGAFVRPSLARAAIAVGDLAAGWLTVPLLVLFG